MIVSNLQEHINIHYTHRKSEFNQYSGVYQIRINNKLYVGSASKFYERIKIHLTLLRGNRHYNKHLQYSFNKHGESKLEISILEFTERNATQLATREQYYMDTLKPEYNIFPRARSSAGRIHTEETKLKISNSSKGKTKSEEHRKNMSLANLGKKHSEESIQKMRNSYKREFRIRPIVAINISTREEIYFNSIIECCKELKVDKSNLHNVLKGKRIQANGYKFKKI